VFLFNENKEFMRTSGIKGRSIFDNYTGQTSYYLV
jgi:hypothetical protein